MEEKRTTFYGTYFNKSSVLAVSRWAGIIAWVVLAAYLIVWVLTFSQFVRQMSFGLLYEKGFVLLDVLNFFTPYLTQAIPGVAYFFGLKFVEQTLLILLDMEENARRAVRLEK